MLSQSFSKVPSVPKIQDFLLKAKNEIDNWDNGGIRQLNQSCIAYSRLQIKIKYLNMKKIKYVHLMCWLWSPKNPKSVCFWWSRLEDLYTYFVYIVMTSIRDNIWIYYKSVLSCKCLVLHPAKWNLVFVNKLFPHALPCILDHNFQFPVFRVHWREKGNCSSLSIGEKLCPRKACLLLDIHIDWKMIALINSDEGLLALIATKISDLRLPIQHVDNFWHFIYWFTKYF